MAKIAGRKNDGAWSRFNAWLIDQPLQTNAFLANTLEGNDNFMSAFQDTVTYSSTTGAPVPDALSTAQNWATSISVGVPRQIWEGVTTYDYYSHDVDTHQYKKLMQHNIFLLSVDLRAIAKVMRFGELEMQYLSQLNSQAKAPVTAAEKMPMKERRVQRLIEVRTFMQSPDNEALRERALLFAAHMAKKSKGLILPASKVGEKGLVKRIARRPVPVIHS